MKNEEDLKKLTDRYFHGKENYNCAQSVLQIAHDTIESDLNNLVNAANWGGGRTEKGYCGALYAALSLTPEDKHAAIIAEFKENVGAILCRDIRATGKTSCPQCVIQACKCLLKANEQN